MGFLSKIFRKKQEKDDPATAGPPEHLVRIHIPLGGQMGTDGERDRWFDLQNKLDDVVAEAGLGECDGNEIGGGEFTIWLYGPDATPLADLVKSTALDHNLPPGCSIFLRHGSVGDLHAKEESYFIT